MNTQTELQTSNLKNFKSFTLKSLTNDDLHFKMKSLISQERKLTHEILLHLMEVDRRKLYLEMAYPSLWEYLVRGLGYSAAAAQRRIEAARLMVQVPQLGKKVEAGSIHLSQVSLLQKALRENKKSTLISTPAEHKQMLVEQMENLSIPQTQSFLAKTFDMPLKQVEKSKTQKDESVCFEIIFSKQEMELINYARDLSAHALMRSTSDGININALMLYLAKKVIKQKTGVVN